MKKIAFLLWLSMVPWIVKSQVIIYSACNYTGQFANLGPGNYYNAFQFHITDNSLSSLRVPAGFRVELYDNVNMLGTPYVLRNSVSCLPAQFNNRTSSIRVTYSNNNPWEGINPEGGIAVYTGCQYSGNYAFLPPGNYAQLRTIIGSNAISSFRVPRGMVVELYSEENFRGATTGRVTSDNSCLTGNYWNNRASSARVYYQENGGWLPPPPPSWEGDGTVRMYSGCSYRGNLTTFQSGNFNDLRAALGNLPLAALQVSPGMEVELYSGPNLTGSIMGRYTSNQSCLSPEIQYRARSARIYSRGFGGGNWDGKGVALYGDCGFRGRAKTLAPGRYSNLNNSTVGFNPASLRVSPGYTIELFMEPNFKGASAGKISENEECLGDYWRNRARSAIVTYNPASGGGYEDVMVYADCYYRGRSQTIRPGYYNNMSSFGFGMISPYSMHVPPGYKLELFLQDNFTGSRIVVTSDNPCITSTWRGRVRSMIVTFNGYGGTDPWIPGNDVVMVYQNCYFGGRSVKLDVGRFASMGNIGMSSTSIASLKVPLGYEVELYQYPNFSGGRTVLRGDNTCLASAFRNRVGSIVVRRNNDYNPYQGQRSLDSTK